MPKTPDEIRNELLKLMRTHDWYYDRADDPRAYADGRASFARMMGLVQQLPDGNEFFQANKPKA